MSAASYPAKRSALLERLSGLPSLAVALSGGVDSSVLLHAAQLALGARALGVLADSPSLPRRELEGAKSLCASLGARLEIVRTQEGQDPDYRANAGDRCYFCKRALFDAMRGVAQRNEVRWLAFGEIVDDWGDHRPGARAAEERGVLAPLAEAGFTKQDVRRYARLAGLPMAEKPANACLASRIPVGSEVTAGKLGQVERAEDGLLRLGLGILRVRHLGSKARLELGAEDYPRALEKVAEVARALRAAGFEEYELAQYRSPAEGGSPLRMPERDPRVQL